MRRALVALGALVALSLANPRPLLAAERSPLEASLIHQALKDFEAEEDPTPQGKIVDAIEIYVVDVFDARDPIPDWVNNLHTTTRDYVVRREVLIQVGERYDGAKVEETERNLRGVRQLSLANIVAMRGKKQGHVDLLVIAKDVWSLRLNNDIAYGSAGLEQLYLNLSEENLAGTHTSLGVLYQYERYRHTGGVRLIAPRVGGSRFRSAAEVRVYVASEDGQPEGSSGAFVYGLPLYSRYAKWGMSTSLEWYVSTTRVLQKNELGVVPITVDGKEIGVPWYYNEQRLLGNISAVRSFGVNRKWNFRVGIEVDERRYRADHLDDQPELQKAYVTSEYVPVSDVQVRPEVQMTLSEAKFHRIISMDSLGFQEDVRKGYTVALSTWLASQELGSTRDIVGVSAMVGYAAALGSGLVSGQATNSIALGNDGKNDASLGADFRIATPWLGIGRLHFSTALLSRYQNYRRLGPYFLGGNSRLRGYPSSYLRGQNLLAFNLEFRTGSIDVLSAQMGLAAYYDLGDTPDDFSELHMRQSVGTGVRILFPQVNRQVLRVDWAFPLGDPLVPSWPGGFFVTFGQAF